MHSAIAIMICALVTDQLATQIIFKDQNSGMILFGLLPALNEDRKPVPDTELIKISRGFVGLMVIALVIGFFYCFRDSQSQVRLPTSATSVSLKFIAILALVVTAAVQLPNPIWHNVLVGNIEGFSFATGTDPSLMACFFWAGVLAFGDGMFPLKVPAIASSHHRSDLPLTLATICAGIFRWLFCAFASTILVNSELVTPGSRNVALAGVFFYLAFCVVPEIIEEQVYV